MFWVSGRGRLNHPNRWIPPHQLRRGGKTYIGPCIETVHGWGHLLDKTKCMSEGVRVGGPAAEPPPPLPPAGRREMSNMRVEIFFEKDKFSTKFQTISQSLEYFTFTRNQKANVNNFGKCRPFWRNIYTNKRILTDFSTKILKIML